MTQNNPRVEIHNCSRCPRTGNCPIEIVIRPFEGNEKELEEFLTEFSKVLNSAGGDKFMVGLTLQFGDEPMELLTMVMTIGYALGKGFPVVKYKPSLLDLKKILFREKHRNAS